MLKDGSGAGERHPGVGGKQEQVQASKQAVSADRASRQCMEAVT